MSVMVRILIDVEASILAKSNWAHFFLQNCIYGNSDIFEFNCIFA